VLGLCIQEEEFKRIKTRANKNVYPTFCRHRIIRPENTDRRGWGKSGRELSQILCLAIYGKDDRIANEETAPMEFELLGRPIVDDACCALAHVAHLHHVAELAHQARLRHTAHFVLTRQR